MTSESNCNTATADVEVAKIEKGTDVAETAISDTTETSSQRYLASLSNQVGDHPYEYHQIVDSGYGLLSIN